MLLPEKKLTVCMLILNLENSVLENIMQDLLKKKEKIFKKSLLEMR